MEADLKGAAFDPDMLDALDGAMADAFAARKARLTSVLLDGETGVVFESLALFAEPLFALYELDPAEVFQLRGDPNAVGDDVVALLETARLLWAFLSLTPSERGHKRMQLASQLVGEDPTDDDWVNLDGLIEAAEIHWKALLPEEIKAAQKTDHPTLSFDALIQHPAFRMGAEADDASHAGFGTTGMSDIEARALFAQPLLDRPEALTDGDEFEEAIAIADELWVVAQQAGGNADAAAKKFARERGVAPENEAALVADAKMMIERFWALFPEHAGAA